MARQAKYYPGLLKSHYPNLRGRDWLRSISALDRSALASIGRSCMKNPDEFQSLGGKARAQMARRDKRGRFMRKEVPHGEQAAT